MPEFAAAVGPITTDLARKGLFFANAFVSYCDLFSSLIDDLAARDVDDASSKRLSAGDASLDNTAARVRYELSRSSP